MDHFGIGAAMKGVSRVYFQSARRTGRTTSLVESLKDGDRVVFMSSAEAERVRRMCDERGLEVECIVVNPVTPEKVLDLRAPVGRVLFDHMWVEQYYLNAITRAQCDIDYFELEASGGGEPHTETGLRDWETAKWHI